MVGTFEFPINGDPHKVDGGLRNSGRIMQFNLEDRWVQSLLLGKSLLAFLWQKSYLSLHNPYQKVV